jgi:N-acetylneuraminate synthase
MFNIGNNEINEESEPYVIAEIGVNHEGCMETAKELIRLAKEGGAHAAKFQSYKAGRIASKDSPSYWDLEKESTRSQYELFLKYDSFGEKEYLELYDYCMEVGIDFMSTPFDSGAVDFLDEYMKVFKVASADLTNLPMLRQIAKKNKPVILSTGASTLSEIDIAVNELYSFGCNQLSLLHCVLNYPTKPQNAHLNMISSLKRNYPNLLIGYSDHVEPDENMQVLTTAYLKGARIIEKHFTNNKGLPGNDHYHSMDKNDLQNFWKSLEFIKSLEGEKFKKPLETEKISRLNARRSIVTDGPLKEGQIFSDSNLTYKRPGKGISPIEWDNIVGKKASRDLNDDHILSWSDVTSS